MQGHDVRFARGFEVDLARAIAANLGIKPVVFFNRLIAPGLKPCSIARERAERDPVKNLHLVVGDIEAARNHFKPPGQTSAQSKNWAGESSAPTSANPDGNSWALQEIGPRNA